MTFQKRYARSGLTILLMRYGINFGMLTVITGGKLNSVMCCVATRNTLPNNAVRRLITNNGIGFGKNPLRIPSNTYSHSQERHNTAGKSIDWETCCSYRPPLIRGSAIKIHKRKSTTIDGQDFSLQRRSPI